MYTFSGRVRYSETDSEERLTLPAITDYFQDCGTFQSEELGLGVRYLQESHMAWMLMAWQIVVEEYPRLGEEIITGTFPYGFKGFMGYRNYVMDRADGKRMAYANAIWTLLDTNTMKPVKATQEMIEKYVLSEKLPMDYAPRKIEGAVSGSWEESFRVTRQHLDSNHHVNNAQYVKMASQYVPEEARIRQMRAEYKKQAHLGDLVLPRVSETNGLYVIALCGEQKEPFAVVEFTCE
ncbi:acyl-ACP thioesterase domain-containing protein [Lachnospiraceae bacterium JLR.KK008]